MTKKVWPLIGAAALALGVQAAEKPNIVLFFVDDLGWNNLGYRNPDLFETPHIDQLAQDSVDFQQAYIASPTCSPSRSTLLTGQHPARLKMVRHIPHKAGQNGFDEYGRTEQRYNLWEKDPAQFPCVNWVDLEYTTYAEALKKQGYYNLFLGKWHLGHEPYHPIHQGFDKEIGTTNWGHPRSYYPPYFKNSDVMQDEKERYLTDKLTDETVRFLDTYDKDQPFMVSLWYYGVHSPNTGRKDLVAHFKAKGLTGKQAEYVAQVKGIDESVGRVRAALKANGLADNTVIILTSDQGSLFEFAPYRGCKRSDTLCEGGARVPFMISWPGNAPAGVQNNSVVQTTDLFPTLVELTGGRVSDYPNLDGVSLLATIKQNSELQRGKPVYGYRAYEDMYASVREGDWKLIAHRSGKLWLFNVSKDRSEKNDLAAARPEKVAELVKKLKAWEKEVDVEKYSGVQ